MYRWPVTTVNNSVNGASENFTVTFHDTRYAGRLLPVLPRSANSLSAAAVAVSSAAKPVTAASDHLDDMGYLLRRGLLPAHQ